MKRASPWLALLLMLAAGHAVRAQADPLEEARKQNAAIDAELATTVDVAQKRALQSKADADLLGVRVKALETLHSQAKADHAKALKRAEDDRKDAEEKTKVALAAKKRLTESIAALEKAAVKPLPPPKVVTREELEAAEKIVVEKGREFYGFEDYLKKQLAKHALLEAAAVALENEAKKEKAKEAEAKTARADADAAALVVTTAKAALKGPQEELNRVLAKYRELAAEQGATKAQEALLLRAKKIVEDEKARQKEPPPMPKDDPTTLKGPKLAPDLPLGHKIAKKAPVTTKKDEPSTLTGPKLGPDLPSGHKIAKKPPIIGKTEEKKIVPPVVKVEPKVEPELKLTAKNNLIDWDSGKWTATPVPSDYLQTYSSGTWRWCARPDLEHPKGHYAYKATSGPFQQWIWKSKGETWKGRTCPVDGYYREEVVDLSRSSSGHSAPSCSTTTSTYSSSYGGSSSSSYTPNYRGSGGSPQTICVNQGGFRGQAVRSGGGRIFSGRIVGAIFGGRR